MGELEKLIRGFVEQMEESEGSVEFVGHISKELSNKFKENKRISRIEKEIIQKKAELYIAQLKKEHDLDALSEQKHELWEEVYKELGISEKDKEASYKINQDTRAVVRVLESGDEIEVDAETLEALMRMKNNILQ